MTKEERLKILNMINEGKISPEEGTKLLTALTESRKLAPKGNLKSYGGGKKWLRVRVTDMETGKSKATVNLPLGLLDAGMIIASKYAPDIKDIAFDEMVASIDSGAEGKIIDVYDEEDGEHVEIFIE